MFSCGFIVPIRKRRLAIEQVLEARLRFASGERQWGKFSTEYGVSREAIKNPVLGLSFKELPMPPKRIPSYQSFPYG
jgi:hypothetical protein